MTIGLLGRKIGMTQIFNPDGMVIPITLIEVGPCKIVQKKTREKDGYQAVQIGFMEKTEKKTAKPLKGHFKKAGLNPQKFLKEFRFEEGDYKIGQTITLDIFEGIDFVDVSGISKGKGFTGAMKRWKFHGGPATHGSMTHRILGSIGDTNLARVYKGRKMPGRMGNKKVTLQSLKIIKRDTANNLLVVKGAIPGPNGRLIVLKKAVKKKHNKIGKKEADKTKTDEKKDEKKG